jgi:hypothetical protein
LLERNAQQQAAARQAALVKAQAEQAAAVGAEQQRQRRIAAGLDPATGRPLSSASSASRLTRIDQEPAAFRRAAVSEILLYPREQPTFYQTIFANPAGLSPYSAWTATPPVLFNKKAQIPQFSVDFLDLGGTAGVISNPFTYTQAGGPFNNAFVTITASGAYSAYMQFQSPKYSPYPGTDYLDYGESGTQISTPPFVPQSFPTVLGLEHTVELDVLVKRATVEFGTPFIYFGFTLSLLPTSQSINFDDYSTPVSSIYNRFRFLVFLATQDQSPFLDSFACVVTKSSGTTQLYTDYGTFLETNTWVRYALTVSGNQVRVYGNSTLLMSASYNDSEWLAQAPPPPGYTWIPGVYAQALSASAQECSISSVRYSRKALPSVYDVKNLVTTKL